MHACIQHSTMTNDTAYAVLVSRPEEELECRTGAANLARLLGIAISRSSLVNKPPVTDALPTRFSADVLRASATPLKASAVLLSISVDAGVRDVALVAEVHSSVSTTPATKQHPGMATGYAAVFAALLIGSVCAVCSSYRTKGRAGADPSG